MIKILLALPAALVFLALGPGHAAWADSDQPGYYDASDQSGQNLLTPKELDDLLAPIALYPDPLIAQILPAATFIDQIDEAARYVKQFGSQARIDDQPWDVSIKAVAHYPDVLFMMDQKYDWTVSLGQAFVDQPQDLMDEIQYLRTEAEAEGNLVSTREQQVIDEPGNIRIVPATPEYIYVPVYDPQVVYLERADPSYGLITFGFGLAIGAWLSRDLDWRGHRVYYHGWSEGGWVGRSRPHLRDLGGVYTNRSASIININKKVVQHDTSRFRQELRLDVTRRRELPGRPAPTPRLNQARPPRIEQQRPVATGQQRPPASGTPETGPTVRDVFRGRDVQQVQPASRSGYGGYGSSKDAATYRERGQTSRENMLHPAAAPPRPNTAPAPRSSVPRAARQTVAPRPTGQPAPRPAAPGRRGDRQ